MILILIVLGIGGPCLAIGMVLGRWWERLEADRPELAPHQALSIFSDMFDRGLRP